MSRYLTLWLAAVALLSTSALAIEVNSKNYDIYSGDLNSDGYSDYYLSPKPLILILYGDISTPIKIRTPGTPALAILRSGSTYLAPQPYVVEYGTIETRIAQGTLQLATENTDFYTWNPGTAGQTSVLLRGVDIYSPSVAINSFSSTSLPTLVQTFGTNLPSNLSNRSIPITIKDYNNDGKPDIISGGYAYLANAAGVPAAIPVATEMPYTTYTRYDDSGRVVGTIASDPDGGGTLRYPATRTTYDATTGLVSKVETGELGTWRDETLLPRDWPDFTVYSAQNFKYDGFGRKTMVAQLDKNASIIGVTQYAYDSFSRVVCTAQRRNLGFDYTNSDACVQVGLAYNANAEPDVITIYHYDGTFGVVENEIRGVGTELAHVHVTNSHTLYNDAGKPFNVALLTRQRDANGNDTRFDYDAGGRLKKIFYPYTQRESLSVNANDTVVYDYDANGNKTYERKRNGAEVNFTYDNNNRLIQKDYVNNTTIKDICYDYDLRGLQNYARFGSDTNNCTGNGITNTFNGFGRLTSSTNNTGGTARTITSAYDNNGNRIGLMHPDGAKFGYRFDGLNRVTNAGESASTDYTINTQAVGVTYQPNGRRAELNRGSNKTTYQFVDGVHLSTLSHTFALPANNIDTGFQYNYANQITQLTQNNAAYYYVGNDNRTGGYTANGLNQYTTINGQPLGYDLNANLTNDGYSIYTYDDENRLISATGSFGSATLQYDPNGRLFEIKVINTTTTVKQNLYDGDALIAEYNGSNIVQRRYLHGDQVDEPWVQYNGTTATAANRVYLYSNYQGSIIAQSDTGNTVYPLAYDSYGIADARNATRAGAFGYTGQIFLPELGLYYYKARIYSPKIGRFLQTDPIGYKDDMDLYTYVGNDPVNKTDPTGMYDPEGMAAAIMFLREPGNREAVSEGAKDLVNAAKTGDTSKLAGVGVAVGAAAVTLKTHGNSKTSTTLQHRYEISNKKTGDVLKTGISGKPLNNDGSSGRANSQVNEINKAAGYDKVEATVKESAIPGRAAALDAEKSATAELKADGNSLKLQCRPDPNKTSGGC